jgi:hypothetical protein
VAITVLLKTPALLHRRYNDSIFFFYLETLAVLLEAPALLTVAPLHVTQSFS